MKLPAFFAFVFAFVKLNNITKSH